MIEMDDKPTITKMDGVVVEMTLKYQSDHSSPEDSKYLFHYRIKITNLNNQAIALLKCCWRFSDDCVDEEFHNSGRKYSNKDDIDVEIAPNEDYIYLSSHTSRSRLCTQSGYYLFAREDGDILKVDVDRISYYAEINE